MSYNEDNILVRPIPYKILRNIHLSDGGSYHVQMNLKAGIDQEVAERVIEIMHDEGLLYRVENTDPQLYDVNYSKFEDVWRNFWIDSIGEEPLEPVNFDSFIERFCKTYLDEVKESNVREMVVEEFFFGLLHQEGSRIPKSYEELRNQLDENYGGKYNSEDMIQKAMRKIS